MIDLILTMIPQKKDSRIKKNGTSLKISSSSISTSGEKTTSSSSASTKINIVSRTNTIETDNSLQCDVMLNDNLGALRVEGEESFVALVDTNNPEDVRKMKI